MCDGPVPARESGGQKGAPNFTVGDPVMIAGDTAYSFDRLEDFSLTTPTGRFAFHRTYYSSDEPWRGVTASLGAPSGTFRLSGVPKPFGSSRVDRNSLRWTHSLYSFVDVRASATTDGGAQWVVRPPVGTHEQFKNCSTDCWAAREPGSPGQQNRLYRNSDGGFDYHQADGKRYVYAHATGSGMYFLTELGTEDGRLLARVNYATPTPCTSVTSATVPWVSSVEVGGGQQLAFTYALKATLDAGNECVLSSISTGSTTLASYTYEQDLAGLLSQAQTLSFMEGFAYDAGFTVLRQNAAIVTHGGTEVTSASDRVGTWSFSGAAEGDVYSNGTACSTYPAVERAISNSAPRVGDGADTTAGLIEEYTYMSGRNLTRDTTVPIKRTDSCTAGGYACSPGSVHWVYAGVSGIGSTCNSSNPGYLYATKNKRDNWTVTPTRAPDGGANSSFEVAARWVGVPSNGGSNGALPNPFPDPGSNGTNALETTTYTYAYQGGSQSVASETRPSALSTDGGVAVTTWVRDSSNRVIRQYQSGATELINGSIPHKVSARFWSYDSEGRVATTSGPCFVTDTTITSCSGDFPLTTFTYFTSGTFNIGKLESVTRKASSSVDLVTAYANYNAVGEPGTVTDENGVVTTFTYLGHNVASRSVVLSGGGTIAWSYTWENEKLTVVDFPEGNRERYCYRTVASASATCSAGTWTGRLQLVRKEGSDGSWSECILYDYWPDGTLKTETRYANDGGTPEARFKRSYASDAHKRQTLVATGNSSTFTETRGYDGADNLAALGPAFNAPPSYCRESGGALSKLCGQMGYDRAERLRQLDLYTTSSSSSPIRACIDYDKRGNVSRVTTGCGAGNTCSTGTSQSTCGSDELSHDYVTDDFGNVVEVRLAGTSKPDSMWPPPQTQLGQRGVFRFEFDAAGNLIRKQTQEQLGPNKYMTEYGYDLLGRRLTESQCIPGTLGSWDCTLLSQHDYDSNGASPPSGCPTPSATQGRVRRIFDPFITRWFQYDDLGRVTKELRLRTGETSCAKALPLSLVYSDNGNLTQMTYGFGRQVKYGYGTGAATDRPTSVSANFFTDSEGTTQEQPVVDTVQWEPYGGLRSYRMRFPLDAGLTATVDYEQGNAGTAPSSWCGSGAMGETLDQTGRLRRLRVHDDSTNIYRRAYLWEADQVRRISSCYLSDTTLVTEDYAQDALHGYDGLQRLLGGVNPGWATNPGPMEERQYTYNARGNITKATVFADGGAYVFDYGNPNDSRADWVDSIGSDDWNSASMSYDKDGQTAFVAGPNDSSTYYSSAIALDYHSLNTAPGPGSGTTYRTAGLLLPNFSYQFFSYWYDTKNRRQAKVHPVNDRVEVYLYDLGHQLLESHGFKNTSTEAPYPTDEYIWLGGRPVAMFRASFTALGDGSKRHRADDSSLSDCGRKGDVGASAAKCGLYFLVTDHLGKPVLSLNEWRLIAGVGEYEPYGGVNRAQRWWQTAHPYAAASSTTDSLIHSMKELGGMNVDMRVHFPMVDTDQACRGSGGTVRDLVKLKNTSSTVLESIGGYRKGDVWSNWYAIPSDGAGMRPLTIEWAPQAGNCAEYSNCSEDCTTGIRAYSGVVMREVEYQRYQSGATPFFPPLRFPGHVWDPETDFHENWHRYYSPFRHGYLSPEPLLQSPAYVRLMAQRGMSVATYSYAANNPVRFTDPTGLYPVVNLPPEAPPASTFCRANALRKVMESTNWLDATDSQARCIAICEAITWCGRGLSGADVALGAMTLLLDPNSRKGLACARQSMEVPEGPQACYEPVEQDICQQCCIGE